MSVEHKLPSGAVLDVTPLGYEEAWKVAQDLMRTLEALKVDLKGVDVVNITEQDVLQFSGPVFAVLSSDTVLAAAKRCFVKCTYNKLRIDGQTFEPTEARGDFLLAAWWALKENVYPFFGQLISFFKAL